MYGGKGGFPEPGGPGVHGEFPLVPWEPGQGHACKCAQPGSPSEELEKFDAVFAGRVVSIERSFDLDAASYAPGDRTTVGFVVSAVWKGNVFSDMYITRPPPGGSCGFAFTEGEDYIIYAYDRGHVGGSYTASICSRTAPLGRAQADLDVLEEGHAPPTGTGGQAVEQPRDTAASWEWWVVPAVVLAVLMVIVVPVYARWRPL